MKCQNWSGIGHRMRYTWKTLIQKWFYIYHYSKAVRYRLYWNARISEAMVILVTTDNTTTRKIRENNCFCIETSDIKFILSSVYWTINNYNNWQRQLEHQHIPTFPTQLKRRSVKKEQMDFDIIILNLNDRAYLWRA